MPISLDLVNFAEAFRIPLLKSIAESFVRLGEWLKKRITRADDLEKATSRIPVVWLYNEAVTLWIDASQKDVLAPKEPQPSFGDHLKAAGDRLWAGLKDVVELPREALIIPRFFDAVLAGVDEIVKSVERFRKPSASMFDTKARTASDLFGEAVLAFRALYSSKDQLWGFWTTLRILKGSKKESGSVESVNALPDLFERVTRYIVAGLYLIPLLPEFIKRVWKEASIFIRGKVLDEFADVEEKVFGVRRTIIDLFYVDLRGSLRKGLAAALAWRFVATAWVELFLDLSERWGKQLFDQFRDYFTDMSEFIKKMTFVFHELEGLLEELTKIDLMPILIGKLETKGKLASLLASPPSITLGDLADQTSRAAANKRMQDWLTSIERRGGAAVGAGTATVVGGAIALFGGPIGWVIGGGLIGGGVAGGGTYLYLRHKLKPVREILNIALETKTEEPEETAAFTKPLPQFPDISEAFTTLAQPLRELLAEFVPSLQSQTKELIDTGVEALDTIGKHFDRAAASALRGPSAEQYLAISGTAASMAEKMFPADDVIGNEPDAVITAIARSWENWFARSEQGALAGFDVIGSVIPKYIAAMRDYWAERQAAGEEATVRLPEDLPKDFPTSPHIMALRPVLSRTMVPRVTIDATGHALDQSLMQRVADAFLDRVQAAHVQGVAKLASIEATSGV